MPPHDETARLVQQFQAGDPSARQDLLAHTRPLQSERLKGEPPN